MTDETIPVPAESARKMALSAVSDSVPELSEQGYDAMARRVESHASKILEATAGRRGEFASVNAHALSSVTVDSQDFSHHRDAARHFLEQYGVWDES